MVYKLHPGDIIGAWLRWQGAVIAAANKFIAVFFLLHCTFLRLSYCTYTRLSDVAHYIQFTLAETAVTAVYFHICNGL